jgi:threonine dehydrogenase-like Zn-dependent dehydrogenase
MLGHEQTEVRDVPEPEPKDDLVVVKIASTVLCGTEHAAYEAPQAIDVAGAAGHEAAGVVHAVDRAQRVKPGDRVSIYPTVAENCHECPACRSGVWQLCSAGKPKRSRMGTHLQYMLLPEYLCIPLPEDISFEVGAMLADCIGTPHRAIKRLGVTAGETVLITGVGPIGGAADLMAGFVNARVIVVDTNDYRLEHAVSLGADHAFNPDRQDVLAGLNEITDGAGVDVAIDCSGVDVAQVQCLDAVRPGGKVAFLGIRSPETTVNVTRQFILKELTVIGSWASTPQEQSDIIEMVRRGLPVDRLITHRYGIDAAPEAFQRFFGGEAVKVALDPWAA